MSRRTTVILGAGQAGGRMAEAIRAAGLDDRMILIGEEDAPPYERPPLSKDVLTGKSDESTTLLSGGDAHWRGLDVDLVLGARAEALDLTARTVRANDAAPIRFDRLVIATGSRARALPGLDRASIPVLTLRSLADARRLRPELIAGRTLLLIGGGVIGLEVAASAVALGLDAVVVEAGAALMNRATPAPQATRMLATHRARGVDVRLLTTVTTLDGRVATLSDGTRVEADLVVVGVGSLANDGIAAEAGLPTRDGIIVDAHGRTADPGVFAVGDVARHPLPRYGLESLRQETWRHADNHPRAVSAAMHDPDAPPYDDVPGFWSDQNGERLLVEGLPGLGTVTVCRGAPDAPGSTFHLDDAGTILGAATLGDGKTMAIARRLIAARARPDPARLADEKADLRPLLR